MTQGTDPTTFLNFMALNVERVELSGPGLLAAYGADAPNTMSTPPFTMRWISRANFYNERTGPLAVTYVGPQDRTYHVNVYLVLGVGAQPPATMFTTVNAWMDRMADAYCKYVSVNGIWQRAKVLTGVYIERQMGTQPTYGIDYDIRIETIVTPTIS